MKKKCEKYLKTDDELASQLFVGINNVKFNFKWSNENIYY